MSATNSKLGFKFPQAPKERLTPDQARKRHFDNLAELEKAHLKLKKMIDELDTFIEDETAVALEME